MEARDGLLLINPYNAEMLAVERGDISNVITCLKNDTFNASCEKFLSALKKDDYIETMIKSGSGIGIIPTLKCNFSCDYCFEKNFPKKEMNVDMIADIRKFVDIWNAEWQCESVCEEIGLMGGEVLMESTKQLMEEVFQEFGFVKYKITTNGAGILLYQGLIRKYRPKMVVSLDGTEKIQMSRRKSKIENVYQQIIEGIDFLVKEGIETEINVVFHTEIENREYRTFLDELESYGWQKHKGFSIVVSVEMDRGVRGCAKEHLLETVDKYRTLLREDERTRYLYRDLMPGASRLEQVLKIKRDTGKIKTSYCGANRGEGLLFAPDGYVYNCNLVMSEKNRIGQFYPGKEIYSDTVNKFQKRKADTIPECRDCKMKLFCGAGCPVSAITSHGSIEKGFCGFWKDDEVLKNLDIAVNVEELYKRARKYER